MDSLIVALNAILPTFLLLAFGYALRHAGLVTPEYLAKTNALTFKFFLPILLFNNIYRNDLAALMSGTLFLFAVGSLLLLFLVLLLIVPRVVRDPRQKGVVMQGIFRSNYVIFGVSLVTNVFGSEHAAVASVLSAILVPMYNVLAVVALALFTSGEKVHVKNTLKSVVTNPLIIAAVFAVVIAAFGLRFPSFLEKAFDDVAGLATPLALIVLGGDFSFRKMRGNLRIGLITVLVKLVALPLFFVPLAVMAGLRDAQLLALSLAWATPVAVSSYIMAQQAGADGELAGQLVVLSSACCIPTVFLLIFILRSFALI